MTTALRTVVWIDRPEGAGAELLGGKLGSLVEMTEAGFDVPPAFGITTDAFTVFAESIDLQRIVKERCAGLDLDDLQAVERVSAELAKVIEEAELPRRLVADITAAYEQLEQKTGTPGLPVAVRSSGVSEDLEGASFAGQYDTYLWVCGIDDVLANVRRCWSGVFGPQVLTYRPQDGVPVVDGETLPGMCVGVQQMVQARAAGVMFTLDPLNGDRSKIVLEGCWGLGEGVVKGDVTPDRFRVDKVTLELLASEIGVQAQEYGFDEATREVALLPVEPQRGERPCLSDEEVVAIAELGKRIERHRGVPMDMEWAVDQDGRLHLLQARPETVWAGKPVRSVTGEAGGGAVDRVVAKFLSFGGGTGQ
ncbi:MAG TPA: PEP/pyruvate-binding domain-containing protein [Baekduia sp.]|uniref:PEP/pyruvate-binding domain-containing protein n=1 Tax=Baekduia sp. TaxID=2600305 RepID=UPI002BD2A1F3|nr:PEP/pyruvate-binding domain-containing protein [Baekduia sp.]HMJ33511.1 PEP/pyruvate-binding domain-containing protein [Baekduia sp.]